MAVSIDHIKAWPQTDSVKKLKGAQSVIINKFNKPLLISLSFLTKDLIVL